MGADVAGSVNGLSTQVGSDDEVVALEQGGVEARALGQTAGGESDDTDFETPWVWERKYEIDSLCYPVQLAYLLWKETGRTGQFNDQYKKSTLRILDLFTVEQDHSKSPYYFRRTNCPPTDTLTHDGHGAPVAVTGMTWSG